MLWSIVIAGVAFTAGFFAGMLTAAKSVMDYVRWYKWTR